MDGRITIDELEGAVDKLGGRDGLQRLSSGNLVVRLAAAPAFQVFRLGGTFHDCVIVSIRELGLEEGTSYSEICARGIERGLRLSGDNSVFEEDFRKLPHDEPLHLTMGVLIRDGERCIRAGSRDKGMFTMVLTGRRFNADEQFIFAVPRRPPGSK